MTEKGEGEGGEEEDSPPEDIPDAGSLEEPPPPPQPSIATSSKPVSPSMAPRDARAQAAARRLAGATGRRAALGKATTSGENKPVEPSTRPTPSLSPKSTPVTATSASVPPRASSMPPPVSPSTSRPPAATPSVPPGARRPLVDASRRKATPIPFYRRIPIPRKVAFAALGIAVVLAGGWYGWRAYDRSRHADEYAVREELFDYKLDHKEEHLANIDAMGVKGAQIAVGFLTDMRTVQTSLGTSTTTTAELAHMYLMHYARRIDVEPPAKALDVVKFGGVRQTPADWAQLKELWGKWLADAQASGKAR